MKTKQEKPPIHTNVCGRFNRDGCASNYGDSTIALVKSFTSAAQEALALHGIGLAWLPDGTKECDLDIRLVEVDTGNKTLRTILSWGLPPWLACFVGPAAVFEVEGHYSFSGRTTKLAVREEVRKAILGTGESLKAAATQAAATVASSMLALHSADGGKP